MGIVKIIKRFYRKEQFIPSLFSLFINPNFIVRRALYKGIKRFACKLSGSLMDLGCGTKPFYDLFVVNEYIGVDIHNTGHNNDTRNVDVFYDGKQLPFQNERFDSVLCTEAITHIFETNQVVGEMSRVLKKDGLL
jgi:ubiquinone/menaquinone biosynthesis C-methylase UbiE